MIKPECNGCLSWSSRTNTCLRVAHGMACVVPLSAQISRIVTANATLPTDAKARKAVPIFSGVLRYFPDAIAAVAACSQAGNDQHHPGEPLHWDRSKSTDELDALTRHLVEAGTVDTDGIRHSAKVAWRALANLQKEIERERTAKTVAVAGLDDEAEALTFGVQCGSIK
jgi:hypothetical protein